jgi:mRNA interferase MazF
MTTYNFGDVVLVGFPHTDLQSISKRPALVLYDAGDQDILVARITTQEYTTNTDYKIINWQSSGLLASSFARLGKQATIEKQYVIRMLGKINASEIETIKSLLEKMFGI